MRIDPRDIQKLINGEITVEDYAAKYGIAIKQVRNFKKLYSMIDKVGGAPTKP